MATAEAVPAPAAAAPSFRARAVDALRNVAHLSHEARMLKSVARDAMEDRAYQVRRSAKVTRRALYDATDEAAHRIRREPLKAAGMAFGAGLVTGAAFGLLAWLVSRPARHAH
ncbi:MAG: hypothetical protein AB7H96_16630 [Vicinamibacterales bacterium]